MKADSRTLIDSHVLLSWFKLNPGHLYKDTSLVDGLSWELYETGLKGSEPEVHKKEASSHTVQELISQN